MTRIENIGTLNGLAKAGLIELHEHTGMKLGGRKIYYISDHLKGSEFTHKGTNYRVSYVGGCFFPYVFYI